MISEHLGPLKLHCQVVKSKFKAAFKWNLIYHKSHIKMFDNYFFTVAKNVKFQKVKKNSVFL